LATVTGVVNAAIHLRLCERLAGHEARHFGCNTAK